MKKLTMTGLFIATTFFVYTQKADDIINAMEVARIEGVLAADDMMGRRAFTPHIDKAADFIAGEFEKNGLDLFPGAAGYRQEFFMIRAVPKEMSAKLNGSIADAKNIIVITCQPELKVNERSGYEKVFINQGANLGREARTLVRSGKNLVVVVDNSFSQIFSNLSRIKNSMFKSDNSVIFILNDTDPATFEVETKHEINEQSLANVVAVIPGSSRKDEYVIFSAHYDHVGTGKPVDGDSIYNGANDDAAGTTGVIMLSKYFRAMNSNERTLIFAAFTAEEVGGFGSQYFSSQLDPEKVVAMFNIEMIGTESKWGANTAFITGYEKTDMGAIMQKNLEGSGFTFHPDPYTEQSLFYRSDNATLARLGVPAHTISTAKMENEPHYHKVSDEVETLDMENMAMIIKSIAISASTIISGKDTPTRVKVEELR